MVVTAESEIVNSLNINWWLSRAESEIVNSLNIDWRLFTAESEIVNKVTAGVVAAEPVRDGVG